MVWAYCSRELSRGRYDTLKPSSLHFCMVASSNVSFSAVTTSFGRTMVPWFQESFIPAEISYQNTRTCIISRAFVGGPSLGVTIAIRRRHRALAVLITGTKIGKAYYSI